MKLSCILPAHNEEGCIESTVRQLSNALKEAQIDHEIRVINDNSTDQTGVLLNELSREIKELVVIDNDPPNGFGFAVRKGLESFMGDVVCINMADASDSPLDVVAFYNEIKISQKDCVFGTRWSKGGKVIDYPFIKKHVNRLANHFIRLLFRIKYNDITNAFKMYRAHVIPGLQPFLSPHFNLTVEMPLKAIVRGYSYSVLPNSWTNRTSGESKLKIKEMGSRYLFIVFYCLIEKWFSMGDYKKRDSHS